MAPYEARKQARFAAFPPLAKGGQGGGSRVTNDMIFNQTLSAELPPPRDDEPPSLRQDILDELADHLACAYRRELLRGADATVAKAARPRTIRRPGGRGAPALV